MIIVWGEFNDQSSVNLNQDSFQPILSGFLSNLISSITWAFTYLAQSQSQHGPILLCSHPSRQITASSVIRLRCCWSLRDILAVFIVLALSWLMFCPCWPSILPMILLHASWVLLATQKQVHPTQPHWSHGRYLTCLPIDIPGNVMVDIWIGPMSPSMTTPGSASSVPTAVSCISGSDKLF